MAVQRQLGQLFEGQSVAGLGEVQLLERFVDRATSRPSPRWWPGTGRWSWASAAGSWPTRSTSRTPSRRRSWSWSAGPGRSGTATGSAPWLFGVARRVGDPGPGRPRPAAGPRERRASRRSPAGPASTTRPASWAGRWRGDRPAPRPLREPILLCCVEGLTYDEAAARLRSTAPADPGAAGQGPGPPEGPADPPGVRPDGRGPRAPCSSAEAASAAVPRRW